MKKALIITSIFLGAILSTSCTSTKSTNSSIGNFIATVQLDEPVPGVCNSNKVITVLPLPGNGQTKAEALKTNAEIEALLNERVSFLKDKPDFNGKGMVNMIINCKGIMVRCQTDNKTQSPELDKQILAVFAELKNWKAGSLNGKPIDTMELQSFTISNGKISLN